MSRSVRSWGNGGLETGGADCVDERRGVGVSRDDTAAGDRTRALSTASFGRTCGPSGSVSQDSNRSSPASPAVVAGGEIGGEMGISFSTRTLLRRSMSSPSGIEGSDRY